MSRGVKKPRFTLEKHTEYGELLKHIRVELLHLQLDFYNSFPTTEPRRNKILRNIGKMLNGLTEVKSELEEVLCKDYPVEFTTKIYYGQPTKDIVLKGDFENEEN